MPALLLNPSALKRQSLNSNRVFAFSLFFGVIFFVGGLFPAVSFANDDRGLLPELKANSNNEEKNEATQFQSEIMISKAEDKAIESLQSLLRKKKGTEQEADLLYRLAELLMRKAKTGRFFDLHSDSKTMKLSSFPIPPKKGRDWIQKASQTYFEIEKRFPRFREMDGVIFNNAFANQQLGELATAEKLYKKLLTQHPQSPLVPDALMASAELLFEQARFHEALAFLVQIEKFPDSKVYSYGLYKQAWAFYNLKRSQEAVEKLVEVVKKNPPRIEDRRPYSLRGEALRDLVLFVSDSVKGEDLYDFFKKIATSEELGQAMMNTARLYESYNREKEIQSFLNKFIAQEKNHPYRLKAHMSLVQAQETLKKRDEVLKHLKMGSELCDSNSTWKASQVTPFADDTCANDYRKTALEIAKKWWEIWLKNKAHSDFSKLTEQALRLVLKSEDPARPDFKTRLALAELLFQQGQYDEASLHYEAVGKTSTEPELTHDADYSALFAVEKSLLQEKTKAKQERLKALSLNYLQRHPKGSYSQPVQLQVAISEYEENHDEEAEKALRPLVQQETNSKINPEVRRKAEDLMLDIYNLRKKSSEVKRLASLYLQQENQPERRKALQKIYEEAHYSEVQSALQDRTKMEVSGLLVDFRKTHPQSPLAKEALWQALSLAYGEGHSTEGARLSHEFASAYPEDSRSLEALREAAKAFLEAGRVEEALTAYLSLGKKVSSNEKKKLQEVVLDLQILLGRQDLARQMILNLIQESTGAEKRNFQEKYLATFSSREKDSSAYRQFQQQLLAQGVEPFSTQFLTREARQRLDKKEWTGAFQSATRIMTRAIDLEHRAEARYIQARVLEHELTTQSVKTSKEEKLSLILNIKTEKLEKALTAYNSAAKMKPTPALLAEILEGLNRCYENYVTSLQNLEAPGNFSPQDRKALKDELSKILEPILAKQQENREALVRLTRPLAPAETPQSPTDLNNDRLALLRRIITKPDQLKAFLPEEWKISKRWEAFSPRKPLCSPEKIRKDRSFSDRAELLGSCYWADHLKTLETEAFTLADTPQYRSWGLFYLSLVAEKQGLKEKALWLIEKSLNLEPQNEVLTYQKARLLAQVEGLAAAQPLFASLDRSRIETQDLAALEAWPLISASPWSSKVTDKSTPEKAEESKNKR
jgi:tetratricopeptide (TPR) repeat protein